jgi:hypothetical protein
VSCTSSGARRIGTAAPDYSVSLVSAIPEAGTSLLEGQTVVLTITVDYRLAATDSGRVVLAPQDDKGKSLVVGRPQASRLVHRGAGRVTLCDTLTVPSGLRRVQLFILLAPWGFGKVSGELFIGYPVRRSD